MRVRGGRGERGVAGAEVPSTASSTAPSTASSTVSSTAPSSAPSTEPSTAPSTWVSTPPAAATLEPGETTTSTRVYALARGDASHRRRDVDTVRRHTRVSTLRRSRAEDASRARRERRARVDSRRAARETFGVHRGARDAAVGGRSKDSRRRSPREPPRSRRFACETSRAAGRTAARERVPPRTAFACVFRRAASPFPPTSPPRAKSATRRRRKARRREKARRTRKARRRPTRRREGRRTSRRRHRRPADRSGRVRTSCVVASPRGRGGDDGAVDSPRPRRARWTFPWWCVTNRRRPRRPC